MRRKMKMSNKINVCFISDDALETFKANLDVVYKNVIESPTNKRWMNKFFPENIFVQKKYMIEDFDLKYSENNNYKEVDYENSITLYEHLNALPRYILTDERFWLWLNIKYYKVALQAMKINSETTLENHWTFKVGKRRGIFFGVLSRMYFRVEHSVDETLDDKYELTKYVIGNPERYRTLSWRTFSSRKTIVLGALKAQKDFEERYPEKIKNTDFNLISKRISRYGSVNLLDSLSEEDVYKLVYDALLELSGVKQT